MTFIEISGRRIGEGYPPFVIAEIGINHEGEIEKAIQMVDDAISSNCECVKFQYHIISDEMIPNDVIPGNAEESIWEIMKRCSLSKKEEIYLKDYVTKKGLIYLSTPFSRAAANELNILGVDWFKIGSGECNNYPLINHIASFKKPIILSTGMNNIESIKPAVDIFRKNKVPYGLLHCTSMYPTPYEKVRLGAIKELKNEFPDAIIGLSDHSLGIYTCLGAVSLGASILEKHFTSNKNWDGPDISISIDKVELQEMIRGSRAIYQGLGGSKEILLEEQPTIDFAYSSVVSIKKIKAGEVFNEENIWVKRPGTGEIKAKDYDNVLNKFASRDIDINKQLTWEDVCL